MEKDFDYYKNRGDKYFWKATGRNKKTSESIDDLDEALKYYRGARARTQTELDRSVITRKINQVHQELGSLKGVYGELQKKLYACLSIFALAFALFLVSFNLTGNAIGGITLNDTKWIGVCFFLCGLTFAFIYLQGKKRF